ncbi:hypothetical protein DVH05_001868 [Phytophthora capsici]|nr:hypothetical protein DVH05_001868 [Phytophthora capsici]
MEDGNRFARQFTPLTLGYWDRSQGNYMKSLDRQPEVTGLEGANSPVDSDNQVLEIDLSDEEDTDVDSQFDSPTGSPLLVADAACPTCETLDDALEIAKTRELASYLRIEQLEEEVAQLQRDHEEERKSTAVEAEESSISESQCVLDVDDEETDETKALAGNEGSGVSSIVHASSLSLASAALLAVVVEALKKRSPTEALAIVLVAVVCMGIMLASFAWNIATATL